MSTRINRSMDPAHRPLTDASLGSDRPVEAEEPRSVPDPGDDRANVLFMRFIASEKSERQPAGKSSAARPEGGRKRILVVDDNRDAASSLAALLRALGNDAEKAYSGEEAVKKAAEFEPDIVFLDIGLPNMDGCEACRQIRRQPGADRTYMIALTGWDHEDDRRRFHEAGFHQHLVKPVSLPQLDAILSQLDTSSR